MKRRVSVVMACALALSVYFSCSDPFSVKTKLANFLSDGHGFRRFYADDPGYFNYSFWLIVNGSRRAPMDTVETQVNKVSGASQVAEGVLFCYRDSDNYYLLTVYTDGGYAVYKRVKDAYTTIIRKTITDKLAPGYDVVNDVRLIYDKDERRFSIFFNDSLTSSFVDSTYSGGSSGYFATIGSESQEDFPAHPVDVRFKEIKPVKDPR
jgi:hypothetical protein